MKAAAVALVGFVLLAAGLVLSPAPWLAFAIPGALLIALGLLMEVDDGEPSKPPSQ